MATIERSIEVERPAADVWAVLEDVRQIPAYSPSTVAVSDAPDRLSAVGQQFRQTVLVLGRRFESDWTVTELQPGRRVADALGAQRRAQREAEEVLTNLKTRLEADQSPASQAAGRTVSPP